MSSTLSYTCCNKAYEDFVPLFAASTLVHNEDFVVEVGLEDAAAFQDAQAPALALLAQAVGPERLVFGDVAWTTPAGDRLLPNVVRFVTTPRTSGTDYVYLTDVDIVVLDTNVSALHVEHMRRHDAPYSNMVRVGTKRLTGLHFTEADAHYPLPDLSDLDLVRRNDEEILYEIVERRGTAIYDGTYRPVHGIHISPNRRPTGQELGNGQSVPGWGINAYVKQFRRFDESPLMRDLAPLLSRRVRGCLAAIRQVSGDAAGR